MTWEAAMDNAQASFLGGVAGTLVNVNSADEQSFVAGLSINNIWIGASDKLQEGVWRWFNGDTAGDQFWNGAGAGSAVGGTYSQWHTGEPNDAVGIEDYAHVYSTAVPSRAWNDNVSSALLNSLVEWTGAAFRAAQGVAGSVMENATAGTVIGTLAATDADSGETLTYSIVGANTNFEVVGNQLRVRTGANLNFEAAPQHTLTVRVTDSANNTRDQLVTINVVNVNEAPTNTGVIDSTNLVSNGSFETNTNGWTLTASAVRSNTQGATTGSFALAITAGNGAVDGMASTTLATTVGQTYTVTFDMGAYAISGGINSAQTMNFQVQGASTLINENIVDAGANTNTFNAYRYTFVADSTTTTLRFADVSSGTTSVDMMIDNVQAYAVTTTNPTISLAENSANGTVIGQVTSTDPDAFGVLSYSLTDNAGGRFAINSATGQITVANGSLLDFESASSHTITVRTTDQGGLTFDKTVTVNLTNVNETPTALTLTGSTTGAGSSAVYNATTDSYYTLVSTSMTWEAAMDNAQASFLGGVAGTLINIDSAAEHTFANGLATWAWVGASDKLQEGIWRWYNGDTAGAQFWSGVGSGSAVGGLYQGWNAGEPSNTGGFENYAAIQGTVGNDAPATVMANSIVEWTGVAFRALKV